MEWISGYAAIAVLVAGIALVAAAGVRDAHIAAPDRPGVTAVFAGLLWPVVVVGVIELLAVMGLRSSLRSHAQLPPRHNPESRILSASGSSTRGSWGSGR